MDIRLITLRLAGSLGAVMVLASPGLSETTFQTIFREGTLASIAPGTVLNYDHDTANLALTDPDRQRTSAELDLELTDDGQALVSETTEAGLRPMGGFDASVGNPLAMVFLESTIRNMAEATGGSPFYIRNRLKESLAAENPIEPVRMTLDNATVEAKRVTLTPFADDDNRDRMGDFADLTIEVTVSDAVPGYYVALTARTPEGDGGRTFSESFVVDDLANGAAQ